jgi:transposase
MGNAIGRTTVYCDLAFGQDGSMSTANAHPEVFTAEAVGAMSPQHIAQLLKSKTSTIAMLQHQLDWFKRQLFGKKSERFVPEPDQQQMHLGQILGELAAAPAAEPESAVPAHKRRKARSDFADDGRNAPFFDESKVPVQVIEVPSPEAQGLRPEQYEVIGEKVSHRLAQRPGSYVVIKYVRPVIKRRDTQTVHCAPAPMGVIEGSRADVSFIVGLLLDKFRYHLPLYRQHQRLHDAGFKLSRPWLTQIVHKASQLLEPIVEAMLASICAGHVITMDEVPVKAGLAGNGKMKATYFWPVYGDQDEVCFPHFESREHKHVEQALGSKLAAGTVLLSDGYGAYEAYAKKTGIANAQCWAHSRRGIFEAKEAEPKHAAHALEQIATLYKVEQEIRDRKLTGEAKRQHRLTHTKPLVDQFFKWVDAQFEELGLLPSNPLTKALAYIRDRRAGLSVFLEDPAVAIDTNHIERALRPIPTGRKNWLFCWTEVGAKHAGIVQSLVATCRLQGVDPYTYLVDVLQRVGQHPAARVAELTPRRWKELFADDPLRSDLDLTAA